MVVKVKILPSGKIAEVEIGKSIFEALSDLGLDITSLCGGRGVCGKCKIEIKRGAELLNHLTTNEERFLDKEDIKRNIRLACQAISTCPGKIEAYIPITSRRANQVLQTRVLKVQAKADPLVRKYYVEVKEPSLEDPKSDEDRLFASLRDRFGLDTHNFKLEYTVMRELPIVLRKSEGMVTVVIWKNRIIGVEEGDTRSRLFGFAVDIGTTKVAGYLVDLNTGKVLGQSACINSQINTGEDIISRISYVIQNGKEGLSHLQRKAVETINQLLREICEEAEVKMREIYEYSLVGNTCMQLFFLGIWPEYLAVSPYAPVISRGVDVEASKLGLKGFRRANAYFLPVIGGFVGADNLAVLLSTNILDSDEVCMAIDIGTNTEIDLGKRERVMVVSCASGPAFEGMQIKYGMGAAPGAIDRFSINPLDFEVNYSTIQSEKPRGICGSGMIDILAALFLAGLIDENGRFDQEMAKKTKRLRKGNTGYEFVLAWKRETSIDKDIIFTQNDVSEIQMAKAAIHTGASILMRRMGYSEEDVGKVFIAGAFGNCIDPENARTIGMYPEFAIENIKFVGNAAGTGAILSLLSKRLRDKGEKISRKVVYNELAADPEFQKEYMNSLYIPYSDIDSYPLTKEKLTKWRR